jgi:hypothetical protein
MSNVNQFAKKGGAYASEHGSPLTAPFQAIGSV